MFRAIIATATEGIATIDTRGRLTTVNAAMERMFGYQAHEILGTNVSVLMPEPFASEHDSYLERYQRTGDAHIIGVGREVQGKRRDESLFPIDLSVGEGRNGNQTFYVAIIRDITDRHDMQAKLSLTERLAAVGELAAGVAHEINNPINTIINCAQLIEDGDAPAPNVKIIHGEGQRIASIVKDLLQFARGDNEGPHPTSIREVLDGTLRLVGESLRRYDIDLQVAAEDDLPLVLARPQQLQQVILNLLINARDALLTIATAQTKPEVQIEVTVADNGVSLHVRDNGPGVPPRLAENIFEPFVTTRRGKGGTGLGLSVSRSIVESFGGRLTMQNQPDSGADFCVWLPAVTHS